MRLPDEIEYLVERQFPLLRTAGGLRGATYSLANKQLLDKARAFEVYLRKKTPSEIAALVEVERTKQTAELVAKAEQEEQQRFFNQPYAKADFDHWSRATYWTLEEAVALLFGKAPAVVNWETIKSIVRVSRFAATYDRIRDLAIRAKNWSQLYDPVLPGFFLAWAKRNDIPYPPELEAAVVARGQQVADWKGRYDEEQKAHLETRDQAQSRLNETVAWAKDQIARRDDLIRELTSNLKASTPVEPSLGARERDSLLKLVIGMAVIGYGHDPTASKSPQITEIAGDLALAGVPLDADTVRKYLKEAAERLLPPQTDQKE